MFEKKIKEISDSLNLDSEKDYFILTHKKHKREVYFQNNEKSIEFIKIKFDSSLKKFKIIKKIIYFLIKAKVLQIFLKKIKLSSEFGDVIFVANQIKGFDLNKKIVYSFPKSKLDEKSFIKSKEFQKKISEKGFAPKILEINKKKIFSKEELLPEYSGKNDYKLFKKLYSFYKYQHIEKISLKKYVNFLIKGLREKNIKDDFIEESLYTLKNLNKNLLMTKVHGAFTKEQVLVKNDSYVFTDWGLEKNLIIRDLVTFFKEEDLLKNKNFKKILKIYPNEVRENIKLYLVLNEIYQIMEKGKILKQSKDRIKNILKK
tara:strand:- start:1811 stop:2758 length:948 start_codon:yes stop_codon:yes gene_type:complete